MASMIPGTAVEAAQLAEDALEQAARLQQQDADPDHDDFYAYGSVLVQVLRRASELAGVLQRQVGHYGDERLSRDDEGSDPYKRLDHAAVALGQLRSVLDGEAQQVANAYFSAIGHVGVEVKP